IVASGPNPDNETYTITFQPGAGRWTELGLEVGMDESLPGLRYARGADRFVITEMEAELGGRKLKFSLGRSNVVGTNSPEYPAIAAIDGDPKSGWGVATYGDFHNLFLSLRFAEPVRTAAGEVMTLRIHQDSEYRRATIGRFRLALEAGAYSWPGPTR